MGTDQHVLHCSARERLTPSVMVRVRFCTWHRQGKCHNAGRRGSLQLPPRKELRWWRRAPARKPAAGRNVCPTITVWRALEMNAALTHYATLVCGRATANGVELCNAGHCPPLFLQRDAIQRLDSTGLPL